MVRLEIAALYAGVNILILLILAGVVIANRRHHKIALGDGGEKRMLRAVRAHANAAEYIPAALVGLTLLALMDPAAPDWLLHACGLSLTAGRIFHGIGLNMGTLNFGRMAGMLLTLTAYGLIGGGLVHAALAQSL